MSLHVHVFARSDASLHEQSVQSMTDATVSVAAVSFVTSFGLSSSQTSLEGLQVNNIFSILSCSFIFSTEESTNRRRKNLNLYFNIALTVVEYTIDCLVSSMYTMWYTHFKRVVLYDSHKERL